MKPFHFQLLGFEVVVQPTFLLIVGVALLFELQYGGTPLNAVLWGLVVFVSIVVHELGHALVARRFGLRVGQIELHMLGGQVSHAPTKPSRQLAISLAGPGAGLLLGLPAVLLYTQWDGLRGMPLLAGVVGDLWRINVGWSLFNLLPLYPLDGGTALRSGLALAWGERTALRTTAGVGVLLGAAVALFGVQFGMIFVAMLGGAAAYQNFQILQAVR